MTGTLLLLAWLSATFLAAPSTLAQPGNQQLFERAAATIRESSHFTIFDDVYVSVTDSTVALTGVVTSEQKRTELERELEQISGVRGVNNSLRVLSGSPVDAGLRTRVARAIYNHPSFWHYAAMARPPVHIIVERGRVTLTGAVASAAERTLAYSLAQVDGAAGVTNELRVGR